MFSLNRNHPGRTPSFPLTLAQIQYSAKSEIFVFLTLAQIQYSAKSEIFVFPETSDKFSRSHVI
ncbi:hypothetical protein FNH47_22215 [Salmonella enterica subsp. houtenae]|uniref:Uncharacterized protein n=1 Tax=Salmonella houtenae TaxID=59205 RepID=A0A5Y2SLF2_SALHO|nr:hypothetical protein [Salmonella enterica subsp. houtenae]